MQPKVEFDGYGCSFGWDSDFERTYSRLFLRLVGVVRAHGLCVDDAMEVAQDAFVEFWLKRPVVKCPEGWLVWLVRRRAIDRLRRERQRPSVECRGEMSGARSSAPAQEALIQVSRALMTLPPRLRSLVLLRYVVGLSPEEASRESGYAEKSGRKLLARTLARLRRELGVAQ